MAKRSIQRIKVCINGRERKKNQVYVVQASDKVPKVGGNRLRAPSCRDTCLGEAYLNPYVDNFTEQVTLIMKVKLFLTLIKTTEKFQNSTKDRIETRELPRCEASMTRGTSISVINMSF